MRRLLCSAAVLSLLLMAALTAPSSSGATVKAAAHPARSSHVRTSVTRTAPFPGETLDIGLKSFADLVVDQEHHLVFVSQGPGRPVLVTDLDGRDPRPLSALVGATRMTLGPDSTTLYLALPLKHQVAALDLVTGDVTTWTPGETVCPTDVAVTSGLVWFGDACDRRRGRIWALDPGAGTSTTVLTDVYNPQLEASSVLPDRLFLSDTTSGLVAYDTSAVDGPSLTLRPGQADATDDFVISPDGSTVVTAAGGGSYYQQAFATADLSRLGTYQSGGDPVAAAIRADGMVAAGNLYTHDISLYPGGSYDLFRTYDFDGYTYTHLLSGGLAFGATRLYAITADTYSRTQYRLHLVTPRKPTELKLRLERTRFVAGEKATMTAILEGAPANSKVALWKVVDGVRQLITRSQVDAQGRLVAGTVVSRRTTLQATYAGTDDTDATWVSREILVRAHLASRLSGYVRRAHGYAYYPLSRAAIMTTKVSPNHAGDCVFFSLQIRFSRTWHQMDETGCVSLSAASEAAVSVRVSETYAGFPVRVRAEWRADHENAAQAGSWEYLKFVR